MLVRFGYIRNTRAEKKTVSTYFTTQVNFGEIEFSSVEGARDAFGVVTSQVYRTHWAVRPGDYRDILVRLARIAPRGQDEVERLLRDPQDQGVEPPPHRKNEIGLVDSVEAFLKILFQQEKRPYTETFYRGHEDATFELTPSLLRKWENGSWKFMPSEDRLCKEVLIAHHEEFQVDQYCFDRLVRMQHYGLPTRLLDISGNPLVALFFACHCQKELMEKNGEVIIFRVRHGKVKYFDSDTVSCLANLSNLTHA